MKQIVNKGIVLPILLVMMLTSCTRNVPPDTTSPAYQIGESEKLVIPDAIELPANAAGNTRIATFYADGYQKYKAQEIAGSSPVAYQWVLVAPLADLYDASNQKVGTHSIGPTWQLSPTDSLYGQAFNPAKAAASPDASSIDWLQLQAKPGTVPTGIFANATYIQRIATKGGKAPATAPTNASETVNVHYTAIYRITKKNP